MTEGPSTVSAATRARLLGALVVLLVVAVWAFAPTFAGWGYAIAGGGGLTIGLALAVAGARWSWPWYLVSLVAVASVVMLAAPFALRGEAAWGLAPNFRTVSAAAIGLGTSWKDLVTADAPVYGQDSTLLVPFVATAVAALAAGSIVLRSRRPGWGIVPVLGLLMLAVAFGTYLVSMPVAAAVVVAIGGSLWLAWVRRAVRRADEASEGDVAAPWTAIVGGVAMVAVAGAGAILLPGTVASGASRDVVRNHVEPPFDVHDYPSPLQRWRGLMADPDSPVLLTVEGAEAGTRVRLASLDSYDGTVFGVGATGEAGSGSFQSAATAPPVRGTTTTVTVTVGALGGIWVPSIGALSHIAFADDQDGPRAVYANRATGTLASPAGLAEGDAYTLEYVPVAGVTLEDLGEDAIEDVAVPVPTSVPASLVQTGASVAGDATGAERVAALADWLQETGYFSHGLEGEAASLAGHGAQRLDALMTGEPMMGDDEQYAAALALLLRAEGIPSRVVMGFVMDDSGTVALTADQLHAWVEVPVVGSGWVAVDAAPDPDKTVPDVTEPPDRDPVPQVLQPPPPPVPPADVDADEARDLDAVQDKPSELLETVRSIAVLVVAGAGSLALLFAPFLVILLAKARRRRRRRRADRPADAVAGAWDELTDAAVDTGVDLEPGATRIEHARALDPEGGVAAVALARRADAGVFGPADWSAEDTRAYWDDVDAYIKAAYRARGPFGRVRARLSLRSHAARRRQERMSEGGGR
ncbi:transglutaminase-like domain-containing protein [Demequina iriomotensis]|uniref:transglutaminase-like domain-containing protein n=1 Tax=Demequina iriomotensis TaxID=1536641 RepID=UPI0007864788|nr:transglutaminase-like domain-containing protein [Demequina iriomotensis]